MIDFALGTRPEIIKLAPLIRRCSEQRIPYRIIHSGQHYDEKLDTIFFTQFQLEPPHVNLHVGSANIGTTLANMIAGFSEVWTNTRPNVVVVQGDTNTVFAAAIAANKLLIPVAHVEAGLRSFDRSMPEEINRICTDHICDVAFVPTEIQQQNLIHEGIEQNKIFITGNTIKDSVREHMQFAKSHTESISDDPYAIITLHRPALVDDAKKLDACLQAINKGLQKKNLKGIFLVHPRTKKKMINTSYSHIQISEPIGYFEMLHMLSHAKVVITDSGGLQEEACLLHVPCITIRENTERPETLQNNANQLVGHNVQKIQQAIETIDCNICDWADVYPQQSPSDEILRILCKQYL